MTHQSAKRIAWMKVGSFFFFIVGAVLFIIAAIQLFTSVELLDSPWTGGVGCWIIGYGLHHIGSLRVQGSGFEKTAGGWGEEDGRIGGAE